MGTVALDGTKIHANASRHSALSYEHAGKIEAQLKAEVAELLGRAEAADKAAVPDGMSIPEELGRREKRLAKLAEARAKLEARAKERYEREKAEHEATLAAREAKARFTSLLRWHEAFDVKRALAHLGEVVIHLHTEPGVGRATDCLFELHGHFGRDATATGDQIVKLLAGDAESFRHNRNVQFVQRIADELAGVGWVLHLHVFRSLNDSLQGQHRTPCRPRTGK
jgi:hypothetical protein